ncbi:MAG: hypothetical protein CM1200mP18_04210 [Gammaproteobacteria bacterium]|nr:MAG: hypothetical protein CM1200mP18_04210 [Gammaproteobacteria bacterium]
MLSLRGKQYTIAARPLNAKYIEREQHSCFCTLGCNFFWAVSHSSQTRTLHTDTQTGALISILTVVAVFLISSPWWMRSSDWFTTGFWIFAATGLFHPALSLYFTLESRESGRRNGLVHSGSHVTDLRSTDGNDLAGRKHDAPDCNRTRVTMCGVMSLTGKFRALVLQRSCVSRCCLKPAAAVIRGLINTTGKFGLDLMPNAMMAGFLSHPVGGLGFSWPINLGVVGYHSTHPGLVFVPLDCGVCFIAIAIA